MEKYEYAVMAEMEDSHWWYLALRNRVVNWIRHYAGTKLFSILDLGCGTGGMARRLEKEFPLAKLVGVDKSEDALFYAKKKTHSTSLIQGSANRLPFKTNSFDVILGLDLLSHRDVEEGIALKECHQLLKPQGVMIINVPAFTFLTGDHDEAVHTGHRYTIAEVRARLDRAGFELERLTYWNMFLFLPIFIFRQIKREKDTGNIRSDFKKLFLMGMGFCQGLLYIERKILKRINLPFGTSIIAVAHKIKKNHDMGTL